MKHEIMNFLPGDHPWQNHIIWFDTIDSTNTQAKALALQGAPQGTVLIAGQQSGGRGRMGRSFHSPAGSGIYMSVLLRPNCAPAELMHLTCAAATAACDAVEDAVGIRPGIKWTNDLVYGQKKLAGILTELGLDAKGRVSYAIIGIGINCQQQAVDFPEEIRGMAGSLASVTGKPVENARVAAALLVALEKMDRELLSGKGAMLERYRRDCVTLGRQICLVKGDEIRHGTALDIDSQGALIVRFDDGTTDAVNSGEVSIRGMYGYL